MTFPQLTRAHLAASRVDYAWDPRLGFLGSDPALLGTAMQLYVKLKLPFLGRFPLLDAILTKIRLRRVIEWEDNDDADGGGGGGNNRGRESGEDVGSGIEAEAQDGVELKSKVRLTLGFFLSSFYYLFFSSPNESWGTFVYVKMSTPFLDSPSPRATVLSE